MKYKGRIILLLLGALGFVSGKTQETARRGDRLDTAGRPVGRRGWEGMEGRQPELADTAKEPGRGEGWGNGPQIDLVDVGRRLMKGSKTKRADSLSQPKDHVHISALPVAGYTLQTGFAGVLSANFAFYASDQDATKLSSILTSFTYSQYQQIIFPIQMDLWTRGNKYNIVTDWRFLKYPSLTYGLGGNTSPDSGYNIDYSYLRLHQALMCAVTRDLYLGLGYDLDYFQNVREVDPPTGRVSDFQRYGLHKTVVASGVSLHILYDSRRNQINPSGGGYASVSYRPNFTFLGSDANWQSLILDLRKYIQLPGNTRNVLALWSYNWLTTGGGDPPYLLLPSTGWDAYTNTARGYIQGRFRSRNVLYLESEYRFAITHNGLFGGVLFANSQTFSEPGSGRYEYFIPGYGGGLRISLNKFSRTNLCIDYGWGTHGSGGFFVNLGEVF